MKSGECKKLCNQVQMRQTSPFAQSVLVVSAQFFSPHYSCLLLFTTYTFQRLIFTRLTEITEITDHLDLTENCRQFLQLRLLLQYKLLLFCNSCAVCFQLSFPHLCIFCQYIFIPLFVDKQAQHTARCLMVACHSAFCPACPATMDCAVWIPNSLSSTTFCKAQRGDRPPWPFTVGFVVQQKLSKFAIVTLLEGSFRPQLYVYEST